MGKFKGEITFKNNSGLSKIFKEDVEEFATVSHSDYYFDAMFQAINIAAAKNHDYCGGEEGDPLYNFKRVENAGIDPKLGLFVRMMDKIGRMETHFKKGELKVENEGLEDALIDTLNYCALMYALLQEDKE